MHQDLEQQQKYIAPHAVIMTILIIMKNAHLVMVKDTLKA